MKYTVHLETTNTVGTDINVIAGSPAEAEEIAEELFANATELSSGPASDLKWYGVDGEGLEVCDVVDAPSDHQKHIADSQPTFDARSLKE
jgi:hypothetical protein